MGTYTELTIADYPVVSSKSAVVPEVMTIFRETDRHVCTRRLSERNVLVWGELDDPEDDELETAIEYSCETEKVIDRLNVMGFTLKRVREDFESRRIAEVEKYASWADDENDIKWFDDDWKLFQNLTFDAYATAFVRVISEGLRPDPFDDYKKEGLDQVTKYILSHSDDYLFGFPCSDIRMLLRMVCEVVPANTRVVQDITSLVEAGYYEDEEPVCENATRALLEGHLENSSRIILTEGSTDTLILKEAIDLIYPHLSGYYAFLDFDTSRTPGGAGYLVSVVKAFAAAGITNRIIALFDNDTAAHEARRALANVSLPPNITLRAYPELGLLRSYPTLGPGGQTPLDVNGLAASIELYLGEDVLIEEDGTFTPVQWKGFNASLKQYQGEVMEKGKLQARFQKKVERCRDNPELLKSTDWSGLSAILKEVFHAFD